VEVAAIIIITIIIMRISRVAMPLLTKSIVGRRNVSLTMRRDITQVMSKCGFV
jgi:hypothetical protein